MDKGRRALSKGDADQAATVFAEVARAEPDHPAGWSWLGRALLEQARYAEAVQCFDRVLQLDPQFYPDQGMKGQALLRMGNPIDALPCFEAVIERNPALPQPYADRARALAAMKRWEDVLATLDQMEARGFPLVSDLRQLKELAVSKAQPASGHRPTDLHGEGGDNYMEAARLRMKAAELFESQGNSTRAKEMRTRARLAINRAIEEYAKAGLPKKAAEASELLD